MKLKNKRTGEIMEFDAILPVKDVSGDSVAHLEYNSLTEFNEEWEDYEEPKEYWFINDLDGTPMKCELRSCVRDFTEWREKRKEIGNYFNTREEAEQAVEKLKAWKWLKDKGFRFAGVEDAERTIRFEIPFRAGYGSCEAEVNLEFLFGGEE